MPTDKQLIWCWDYLEPAIRHLAFYDAQHRATFRSTGERGGYAYPRYEPYTGEYPQWAKDAAKKLEK